MLARIELPPKFREEILKLPAHGSPESPNRDKAIILAKKEKYYEAVYWVKQCIKNDKKDVLSINLLGLIYGAIELDQESIKQFTEAQNVNPDDALSRRCLRAYSDARPSVLRRIQLVFTNAITAMMMLLHETEEYRYLQGLAEEELGKTERAAQLYRKAISIYKSPGQYRPLRNWDKPYLALAALEAERYNYAEAIHLYEAAQAVNPANTRTILDLAAVEALSKNLQRAVDLLKQYSGDSTSVSDIIADLEKAMKNGWSLT